ncbi:MAG TPA: hypothetical protein VGA00_10610 [Acidiferrobacterales bacterium]|jgi:predicted transcriptional regulator
MSLLSIRLPKDLEKQLADEARLTQKKRAQLVREALADYLQGRRRERFLAEMTRAAGALGSDERARREAGETAEGFLPLDNEALSLVEAREPAAPAPTRRRKPTRKK